MEVIVDFTDAKTWDTFVESHPEGRFCHLYAYRTMEQVYGYRPHYFGFLRNGKLAGVLPVFEASSLLFGRRFVSAPFSEYGGFLLDPEWSEEEFAIALAAVRGHAGSVPVELHGRQGIPEGHFDGLLSASNQQHYAVLSLEHPLDHLYRKVIDYQVRKAIQKAQRSGLTGEERSDETTLREWFFPLYLGSMKRLGAPPHDIGYYLRLKEKMGPAMRIQWALLDGKPVSGLLGFRCGARVNIINIVSSESHWELRPNDLVHWDFIQWAHAEGCRWFDFGSVRYEGQLRYKEKWGCAIREHAYYFPRGKDEPAKETFNSSSPAMSRMSEIWSKYVPGELARVMGPVLRRQLIR